MAFNLSGQLRKSAVFFPSFCVKNAELRFHFEPKDVQNLPKGYSTLSKAASASSLIPNPINSSNSGTNNGEKKSHVRPNHAPLAIIFEVNNANVKSIVFIFGTVDTYDDVVAFARTCRTNISTNRQI